MTAGQERAAAGAPAKNPGFRRQGNDGDQAICPAPVQAWCVTITSRSSEHDFEEARRAQAGQVAEQGGPGVQAELTGDVRRRRNAQAAWTWPQQYRCGPSPASQPATSRRRSSGASWPAHRRRTRGRPAGSGTRRSGDGPLPARSAISVRARASCSAGRRPVAVRCERVGSRPEDRRLRIATGRSQGNGPAGANTPNHSSNCAVTHRARGVAVVIARDHRDLVRVDQEFRQSLQRQQRR